MRITDANIISNNIKLIEIGLPKSSNWFDDNDSINLSDYAMFSIELGKYNIEYRFSISVKLIAECKRSICKGDGYMTPDTVDTELSHFELELDDPYSEEADVEFNLDNQEVFNILKTHIENNI